MRNENRQSTDSQLSKDLSLCARLTYYKDYFTNRFSFPGLHKIYWVLQRSISDQVPKCLDLWLSKIFFNFVGSAHQLYQ